MFVLPPCAFGFAWPSTLSFSVGKIGTPRHVRNGEPNSVTVGGGTPRSVHSRPNAAIARGWARKNDGSFQTLLSSSSRSSGVGGPFLVLIRCAGATLFRSPYSALLRSSLSWRSLTFSIVSRSCSPIWLYGLLYKSETRV